MEILAWLDAGAPRSTAWRMKSGDHPEDCLSRASCIEASGKVLESLGFRVQRGLGGHGDCVRAEWGSSGPRGSGCSRVRPLAGLSQQRQPTPMPALKGGPGQRLRSQPARYGVRRFRGRVHRWMEQWQARERSATTAACPRNGDRQVFMARDGVFGDRMPRSTGTPGS